VLVARYGWHLRQEKMLLMQGIDIDRSTVAFWVGYAAAELAPLYERLSALYRIEETLRGESTEQRRAVRREQSAPHCEALKRSSSAASIRAATLPKFSPVSSISGQTPASTSSSRGTGPPREITCNAPPDLAADVKPPVQGSGTTAYRLS
jgi:Transposase IS66 family